MRCGFGARELELLNDVGDLLEAVDVDVRAPDGVALIAAKRYYFGVGGGTRAFAEALAESGAFECDVAATYADGASNVREILRVRRRNAERGGDDGNPTDAKRAKGTRAGDGGPSRDT